MSMSYALQPIAHHLVSMVTVPHLLHVSAHLATLGPVVNMVRLLNCLAAMATQ